MDDRESILDSNSRGASADAQESGSDRLAHFARTLFEEDIRADSVIEEDRLSVAEIVSVDQLEVDFPDAVGCFPLDDEDSVNYAIRQSELWGGPSFVPPGSDIERPPASLLSKESYALTPEDTVMSGAIRSLILISHRRLPAFVCLHLDSTIDALYSPLISNKSVFASLLTEAPACPSF